MVLVPRRTALVAALAAIPAIALIRAAPSQETAPQRAWTFVIYAAIDNDAEGDGNFFRFFDGVRAAFADDPGIEIVLFADRAEGHSTNATSLGEDFTDARLYRVRSGRCERLAGGAEFPEITLDGRFEPDSADPVHVKKTLAFARSAFPARRYALMLYGHADGRAMCPDEQSRHEMGFAQLTDVVPAELGVDLMALELCNMAGVEIAYQWRPDNGGFSTRTLVAIPNAGPPLDWARVFARLRSGGGEGTVDPASLDGAAFGKLIVEEGGLGRRLRAEREPRLAEHLAHEAVTCLDLDRAAAVKRAVDALAVALAAADTKATMLEVRGSAPDAEATLDYARGRVQPFPYFDLFDLATRIADDRRFDAAVREAARAVAAATDEMVLASWGGGSLRRFAPGRTGVWITFPDGDARVRTRGGDERQLWSLCRWYTPHRADGVYGSLAWCRDGATAGNGKIENWFELLDAWFDAGAADGGANRYAH